MATQYDVELITEAQTELARYLSDEIAPMIFAGSAEVLFKTPPENTARGIHSWIKFQLQGPNPSRINDYLVHAARKVHQLAELELIPGSDLREFIEKLFPMLLSICPKGDRELLAEDLKHLRISESDSETGPVAAKISVSRSGSSKTDAPSASRESVGADGRASEQVARQQQDARDFGGNTSGPSSHHPSQKLERPPETPGAPAHEPGSPSAGAASNSIGPAATESQIDRLNMLLDRWERLADAPAADGAVAELGGNSSTAAAGVLISRIIDEVASSATSSVELDAQLRQLSSFGIAGASANIFRALSGALPDWAPAQAPEADGDDPPPLAGAAETMQKVVKLAKEPNEVMDRFRELISTAVEHFNQGSLGRAVSVIDLAQRMLSKKEVDQSLGENIIHEMAAEVDLERVRGYAEIDDKKLLLRRVMAFFPPFQIDNLMQDLLVEERRDRRRTILRRLMSHGEGARERAIKILEDSLTGEVPQPWYVQRNLVYLIRSIPQPNEATTEREIDLLVRASIPGGEHQLLRESLTALGQIDHPRSAKALVARVSDLEDLLLERSDLVKDRHEIHSLLDTAVKAMVRLDSSEARQCIVAHGLKRRPELGNTLRRLAMLGQVDLSDDQETVNRIIEAIQNELPVKVFGVSVKSSKKSQNLSHLFESLSSTDTPKVRKVYDSIVRKFPGEGFAGSAAKCLTKLSSESSKEREVADEGGVTSLSGDLSLFGLPNLMQNLADSRLEGVLTVLDDSGASIAMVALSDSMMIDAKLGELTGETAIYQLLERPIVGRFIFVNQPVETEAAESGSVGVPVMSLLMEGMRRYDEFNRAVALIRSDGVFKATGTQPTGLPDEDDPDFINGIWIKAARGKTPLEVESAENVDSYRIFRLYEHWVNEGALSPLQPEPAS